MSGCVDRDRKTRSPKHGYRIFGYLGLFVPVLKIIYAEVMIGSDRFTQLGRPT